MYSKLPNYQIRLTQISPPSHPDSYNTLYQDRLSSQSNTSPKLRWTGNSPIWGKITVPTRGSSIYDSHTHTQPTDRLESPNSPPWIQYTPHLTYRHHVCSPERERSTACSTIIYSSGISKIPVQNIPESIQLITHLTNVHRHFSNQQHLKWTIVQNLNTVQYSK